MKRRIKSWCRYWHFNVLGPLLDNEGHSNYLSIVSILDDWHGTDAWENDEGTLESSWKVVLNNINKCDKEQLEFIIRFCRTK